MDAEALIRSVYRSAYEADVEVFLPLLLELRGAGSAAVLGMCPARLDEALYLEHYLDRPVEQEIAARIGRSVVRGDIVEIGNLAAATAGLSGPLFLIMAAALAAADYRWLTFTATPQVEKAVARLNYRPLSLRAVDTSRLGDRAERWGSYYATQPRVMCCELTEALRRGKQLPAVASLLEACAATIARIASELRAYRAAS
jgi:hypothetical protein